MPDITDKIDLKQPIYALPEIHARLNRTLKDSRASNQEIADLIEKDPGLCLVVLRLVNSALYGFRSSISSIQQAVNLLGRNELAVLLLSTGAIKLFQKLSISPAKLHQHSRHSLFCALLAKKLAWLTPLASEGASLFVAGLLHDIGKPVIWHQLAEQTQLIDAMALPLWLAEVEVLGFNHAQVGYALLKTWGLPDALLATCLWHHQPESANNHQDWCVIIDLANRLAHLEGGQSVCDVLAASRNLDQAVFNEAGVSQALEEAERALDDMMGLFSAAC